jgi:hypothetical protein
MKILDPNGLIDNLYKYVHTNIEIAKVEVQEKIEEALRKVALMVVLALAGTMFSIFLFMALALFLNKILESQYLGFLIITFLLGLICMITYLKIKPHLAQPKTIDDEKI